jgi:UDP-galactopyranose mutase
VLERIPLRTNFDNRYFTDKYQALPKDGYTSVVGKMLSNPLITVKLGVSWADYKKLGTSSGILVFTGPIDTYFDNVGLPLLEYRSINFEWYKMPCAGYHQTGAVINYPGADNKYTRSVEYKHFLNQRSDFTIVAYETTCSEGEPYYPIPNAMNRATYEKYKALGNAEAERGVHFIGRLASYKYFNMDQAIRASIDYFNAHIHNKILR